MSDPLTGAAWLMQDNPPAHQPMHCNPGSIATPQNWFTGMPPAGAAGSGMMPPNGMPFPWGLPNASFGGLLAGPIGLPVLLVVFPVLMPAGEPRC